MFIVNSLISLYLNLVIILSYIKILFYFENFFIDNHSFMKSKTPIIAVWAIFWMDETCSNFSYEKTFVTSVGFEFS